MLACFSLQRVYQYYSKYTVKSLPVLTADSSGGKSDADLITKIIWEHCHLPFVHQGHGLQGIQWILVLQVLPADPEGKYTHIQK